MTDDPQTYRVKVPFWHGARLLAVGDTVELTEAQAKYRGNEIEPDGKPAAPRKRAVPQDQAPDAS